MSKTQSFKDVSVDVVNRVYTLINKYGLHTTKRQKKFWNSIHKYITLKSSKYLLVKVFLESKMTINGSLISTLNCCNGHYKQNFKET